MELLQNTINDTKTTVHVYGDSIFKGIVMDKATGQYVPMPADDFAPIADRYDVDIVNKSKFGYTIDRGWALLSRALAKQKPCDVLVLEYGGNDCNHDWRAVSDAPSCEHAPVTALETFRTTLRAMIDSVRKLQIVPVLVSLPPIHAQRFLDHIVATTEGTSADRIVSWLGDVEMIYRFQELYSNTVTKIAYEMGCAYVDLRSAFLDKHNYADLLCADGIHPNEAGHALIAGTLSDAADRMFSGRAAGAVPA